MSNKRTPLLLFLAALAGAPATLQALPTLFTVPPGLSPGDTYQLAFVSTDGFAATSTNIADYNNFVSAEAAADAALASFDVAYGVTWTAIGSTAAVNTLSNAPSSGPVYTLDGVQVASAAQPLYSDVLLSPIQVDQFGALSTNYWPVWTGNTPGGGTYTGHELGSANPQFGCSDCTSYGWEYYGNTYEGPPTGLTQMYGISSVITVTPEPSAFALGFAGCALLILVRRSAAALTTSP